MTRPREPQDVWRRGEEQQESAPRPKATDPCVQRLQRIGINHSRAIMAHNSRAIAFASGEDG